MPFRIALAFGEFEHFERMPVGVAEIERADAAGVRIPIGEELRAWRCMLDLVFAQPAIGTIHVAHDDRGVLKPAIVAMGVSRDGASFGREVLGEFENLVAEAQPRDANAKSE